MAKVQDSARRVYVCHTFYHVYVAYLKECLLKSEQKTEYCKADVLLSTMSTDFSGLKERMIAVGFFRHIITFEEKHFSCFKELDKYKKDHGNILVNMFYRIKFCKLYGKLEAEYIPVDLKKYKDIYVFCDSDPIGYYLNAHHIYYHALEDGLDCIANYDTARYDNRGAFKVKAWMSKHNLIFIQNGYGKYCLDMEVNDRSKLKYDFEKYVEVPRRKLVERLTREDKDIIVRSFMNDAETVRLKVNDAKNQKSQPLVLVLTEPLCALEVRQEIFRDIIERFCKGCSVFIKPHPRDGLDYSELFYDTVVLDGKFPMEILNFIDGLRFTRVYSVLTEISQVEFADECIRLGPDFLDKYEEASVHRQNEYI